MEVEAPREGARDSAPVSTTAAGDTLEIRFAGRGRVQSRLLWMILESGLRHWTVHDIREALPDVPATSLRSALTSLHQLGALRRIASRRRSAYSPTRFVLNAAYRLPPELTDYLSLVRETHR